MFIIPDGFDARMRPAALVALWMLLLALFLAPASAEVYLGDVHKTVTVMDTYYWSGIDVGDGESVEYAVQVQSGDVVNIHLMDDSRLYLFLGGSSVPTVHSSEGTTGSSYTHSTAGKYALVIDNGYGTSVCKVDIVVRPASSWETGAMCTLLIVVGIVILVAVIAVVMVMVRRRRPVAPAPPQSGTPGPQYGGPAYAPAPQYPQQAPPGYPPAPQQYPAPAAPQYPAQAPAGYQAQYIPPPAPPQLGAPPAQPPMPPAAPGAPGQMAQCKYCDFQMRAGTQICPRCGGFN